MSAARLRQLALCSSIVAVAAWATLPVLAQRSVSKTTIDRPVFIHIPAEWEQQHSGRPQTIARVKPNDYVFRVRPGDVWLREASTSLAERSEISHHRHWPMGSDIWFAFDMEILSGLPSQAAWVVVGQLHHTPGSGGSGISPPWAQYIYPGRRFTIQIRHSQDIPLRRNPPPVILFTDPQLDEGRHYSFVYRLRYNPEEGALDTWRDGRKIVTYRGPIGYPSTVGPYLKFGIYRARSAGELSVAFSNIRTGINLCEVVGNSKKLQNLPEHAADCQK